jgi:hypothetical protein
VDLIGIKQSIGCAKAEIAFVSAVGSIPVKVAIVFPAPPVTAAKSVPTFEKLVKMIISSLALKETLIQKEHTTKKINKKAGL